VTLCDLDIVREIETVGARVVGVERSVPDDQYGAPGATAFSSDCTA